MSAAPRALWTRARAKLNLGLRVVGRRPDGYHLLDTVFHELELHDDVAVSRVASGVRVEVTADEERLLVPAGEGNLVVQALRRLLTSVGGDQGFHVCLHKRIPNGGGLGGGSSDAAAALRIGNELLGRPRSERELAELAVGLGADVPFFLQGGTRRGLGVGDELTVAAPVRCSFVLLLPPYGCETARVYKLHAALAEVEKVDTVRGNCVDPGAVPEMIRGLCNDLESAAEQLVPALGELRRGVGATGYPHVRMSGSGSTLFVGWSDEAAARRCAENLKRYLQDGAHGSVEVLVTQSARREATAGDAAGSPAVDPLFAELPAHLRARPAP